MTEANRPFAGPTPRMTARRRILRFSGALQVGTSPMPPWTGFLVAVFATVSAFDDVRLFASTGQDTPVQWLGLACTIAYWLVWMAMAFLPRWVGVLFVLQLLAMLPQTVMGGPLLLTFCAIAVAAYRVPVRALVVMVGSFLIWQLIWVPFISDLGITQLWAYIPVTLLLMAPGLAIKLLRERAIQVEREQQLADEMAAQAALEQRTELARELHDVVTHGLTMIAVQANLGKFSADAPAKQKALNEIGSMARSSLDDLRRLLQTMRVEDQPYSTVATAPGVKPSVACIDLELSLGESQKRLSGLGRPTHVRTSGDLELTPNGLRSTVLRILQESATNVLKHSGQGSVCEISLDVKETSLELVVRSRLTPGKPQLPVSGTGLAGLKERASRLGGSLDAGAQGGWWRVQAVLPFQERQTLH